ncbi:MAG: hypothetical protein QOH65_2341 [Methylobacteriaceae bacterium]|jgi:hypothetical protein|nr:hypothetical protein [Methylobacteriaceae bacterium]
MKRVAFCAAMLAVFALASAPAFARTTLADFRGGGEAIDRLLAKVHKHKKMKVVVKRPGDDTAGTSTSTDTSTTATPTGKPAAVGIDPR